ncbi:HIT family protein [Gordonia insulae]|uniref:HIT domain-containing protein n=1 Tax=Gordonia insulae TaxID=2420509 RepID=A0A3G8JWR4_9ACTN|nr:HIT domain-containing protein [Gordonia insulae]AZG48660.1 hypothetical protein D7316_05280 [Gordonia insulae]
MADWRADRVRSAAQGRNPTVLAELDTVFAVIGDTQFLPGYSLALSRVPHADRLSDLDRRSRLRFLADVDLLATAVENVCAARDPMYRRTNVEILGNTHAFLHAHIWPRYGWEPAERVGMPVWLYPQDHRTHPDHALAPRHGPLRAALTAEIGRLSESAEFRWDR